MGRKKMLLIFNPAAGQGNFTLHIYPVVDSFTKNGFEVTLFPTERKGQAGDITRERAGDFDYLVCSGGDGTLNEVVDALMLVSEKPIFGYIPSGTTNDFAYSIGLPKDIMLASQVVSSGVPRKIDVGQFNDEYFSYVAAFGLFADVSYGTPQDLKNMLGHAAYVLEGMKRLAGIKSYICTINCDGEVITGDFILGMVTNSESVGGIKLPFDFPQTKGEGNFNILLLKKVNRFKHLQEVIATMLGNEKNSDRFIIRSASSIKIESTSPIDWALDGEYGGSHMQTEISVHRQAITIMVPEI